MIETIAITLAAFMIPAAPLNSIMPESYSGYSEPTAYVRQADVRRGSVFTPNGTEVDVEFPDDTVNTDNIDALTYYFVGNEDYSGYYYNVGDELVTLKDKYIDRVSNPTTKFNCLAFAFYMYWENVSYGISACAMYDASDYLNDKSYLPVDEPQVNDIVCYYAGSEVINAGIVTGVDANIPIEPASNSAFVKQLSKCWVQSVWGKYGIYNHRGDLCPFIADYASRDITPTETSHVAYYRRHETHTYTQRYAIVDGNTHKSYCVCGDYETERHTWLRYNRQKYCQYCGYVQQSSGLLDLPTLGDTLNFDFNDIDYKELCK